MGFATSNGVSTFFVRLEYWYDGGWPEVARFDFAPDAPMGHDVEDEDLHMDVYRDGETYRFGNRFPPGESNRAPCYFSTYLRAHAAH